MKPVFIAYCFIGLICTCPGKFCGLSHELLNRDSPGHGCKWMVLVKLHDLFKGVNTPKVSFIGFEIPETVWSNQLYIIPFLMKMMAALMKIFGIGAFISMGDVVV